LTRIIFAMKYKESTKEFKTESSQYIIDRSRQIIQAIDHWAHFIIKYLLFANAFGIILVLSFMGSSKFVRGMIGPKLALLSFLFGFVGVGILMAILFYRMSRFQKSLQEDADNYFSNKIDWGKLLKKDARRLEPSKWGCILAWITSFFFLLV
jgi:hypothetical protein